MLSTAYIVISSLLLAGHHGSAAELKAEVYMAGLRGDVVFSQANIGDPINLGFNIQGIAVGKTYYWCIQEFPVNYDAADRCSEDAIGKNVYPELSGLINDQQPVKNSTVVSPGVDLMGTTSLLGKSIAFHDNIDPKKSACATILPTKPLTTAVVRFQSVIGGSVLIRQPMKEAAAETLLFADLFYVNGSQISGTFDWKIMDHSADDSSPDGNPCENIGSVFDPQNAPEGATCTNTTHSGCKIGDLSGKLGHVTVGFNLSNRHTWSDLNLPLSGNHSVVGKAMAILGPDQSVISCANIQVFRPKTVTVSFSSDGVKGDILFTQSSPVDPTHVHVDLHGLQRKAGGYHVHNFPVPYRIGEDDNLCSGDAVSGHWNPFAWDIGTSPAAGDGTSDQYEVGDLSGKYGLLTNLSELRANFTDWNLPLFGKNSIIGRSIVIHYENGNRWICSTTTCPSMVRTAVATFKYPVIGSIYFQQVMGDPMADTSIYMDLNYGDGSSGTVDHDWHIHIDPVQDDFDAEIEMRCKSVAGHYNPFNVYLEGNYLVSCNPKNEIRCEIGDLVNKHGQLAIRSSKGLGMKYFFTDTTLPLSGPHSIVGRSIVIHAKDSGGPRLACANIYEMKMKMAGVKEWSSTSVSGSIHFHQKPMCPHTMMNIDLDGLGNIAGGYHVHELPILKGPEDPCSGASVSGHFNPFNINVSASPAPGTGTMDMYEVGDLSGKFGRLTGLASYKGNFSDSNLSLFGSQSIVGRSIVIHKEEKNARWVCGNIVEMHHHGAPGMMYRANASFVGEIQGSVVLTQVHYPDGRLGDTQIYIDLKYENASKKTLQHNWHIHEKPMAMEGDCASAGGHYNPYHVDVQNNYNECSAHSPLRCEVGDQSGKHGAYDIGGGPRFYTDVDIPLADQFSVMGKSFVVHAENKGAPRIACADVLPMDAEVVEMTIVNPKPFDKLDFMKTIAELLRASDWMVSVKMESNARDVVSETCLYVQTYISGPQAKTLKSELVKYVKDEPMKLGKYSPGPQCVASAPTLPWSVTILLSAFLLQRWLTL